MRSKLPPPANVDEYLDRFPAGVRRQLAEIRQVIRQAAPTAVETLAYGMPTYRLGVNLVHFAGFPQHIGLYPTPAGIRAFQAEFAGYVSGKGSVQFPLSQPVPLELVQRVVQFRVAEVAGARSGSKSKPAKTSSAGLSTPASAKAKPVNTARAKTARATKAGEKTAVANTAPVKTNRRGTGSASQSGTGSQATPVAARGAGSREGGAQQPGVGVETDRATTRAARSGGESARPSSARQKTGGRGVKSQAGPVRSAQRGTAQRGREQSGRAKSRGATPKSGNPAAARARSSKPRSA